MRIGYIGNFNPEFSTENDVRKAFEHLGHSVVPIQENSGNAGQRALDLITSKQISMLLITSTWDDAISADTWAEIQYRAALAEIPTVTYHLDVFWGSDRGSRRWWTNPMFRSAYVFTASNDWAKEWKLLGTNHQWLRPAVRHDAAHKGNYREDYACDVAFVGSNGQGYHEAVWPYRRLLVDNLREMCQRNGWSWRNPGGDHPKVERDKDRNDFYASAKVTVGDSLCLKYTESEYCSDRAYEATGCGGFLIMPQLNFLDKDYNGKLPMYRWNDFGQLEQMIRDYLTDDTKRHKIQDECHEIAKNEHTYVHRVQEILKRIGLDNATTAQL